MRTETKNCQNCKKGFIIEGEDFNFYEKIKVPLPTWCPKCRMIRRFAFQNTWDITWENCYKCKNKTLSIFPKNNNLKIFCQPCWWSDSWDGTEYAMNYDPSRPFFEQLKELSEKTPYAAQESLYT